MENISKAIIEVMNAVNWVAKNMIVWSWNSTYKGVSDKDVKQVIRDAMIANWLSILPTDVQSKLQIDRWEEEDSYKPGTKKTKQSIFTEVTTKYILIHTSWEKIEIAWYGQGVDTQDKGAGKATTYALKNTLLNMFLIPTGVDTDDTHSEACDVPKTKAKAKVKPLYENFKNMEEKWTELVKSGDKTPESILATIENVFEVSTETRDNILNLWK